MSNLAVSHHRYEGLWANNALEMANVAHSGYSNKAATEQIVSPKALESMATLRAALFGVPHFEIGMLSVAAQKLSNAVDQTKIIFDQPIRARRGTKVRAPKEAPAAATIAEGDAALTRLKNEIFGQRVTMRSVEAFADWWSRGSMFVREDASSTADTPWLIAQCLASDRLQLIAKIRHANSTADVDLESLDIAQAAMSDAFRTAQQLEYVSSPRVSQSHDGILTIHWRNGDLGAALIFDGDGTVSLSYSRPGQRYTMGIMACEIGEPLPLDFFEFVKSL